MNMRNDLTARLGIKSGEVRWRLALRRRSGAVAALSVALSALPQLGHAKTDVFATFRDNAIAAGVVAVLRVPSGDYVINAKLNLDNDDAIVRGVNCRLRAGADFDVNTVRLQASGSSNMDQAIVAHQLVHISPSGDEIVLDCFGGNVRADRVKVRFAKITAIRIDGAFSNVPQ